MFLRTLQGMALLLCAAVLLLISGTVQAEDASNPVVCTVDGKKITSQELLDEINELIKMAGNRVRPETVPQLKGMLYGRALGSLQDKMLLKGVADKKNIKVEAADIDERYAKIRAQFKSEDEFKQILSTNGLTPELLKERMKTDLLYVKVLESEIKEPASPTAEEIKAFYEERKDQMKQEENVTASHILLKFEPTATADEKAKAKEKLQGIRNDIIAKKITFADAAKQNSDCPSKAQGGELGSFGRGQMVPEFDKVAFETKVGEISEILETQFGYHIIQVNGHQEEKTPTLEESTEQITSYLQSEKKQKSQQDYIQQLKDNAKIETLIDEEAWKEKYSPKQDSGAIQLSPGDLNP